MLRNAGVRPCMEVATPPSREPTHGSRPPGYPRRPAATRHLLAGLTVWLSASHRSPPAGVYPGGRLACPPMGRDRLGERGVQHGRPRRADRASGLGRPPPGRPEAPPGAGAAPAGPARPAPEPVAAGSGDDQLAPDPGRSHAASLLGSPMTGGSPPPLTPTIEGEGKKTSRKPKKLNLPRRPTRASCPARLQPRLGLLDVIRTALAPGVSVSDRFGRSLPCPPTRHGPTRRHLPRLSLTPLRSTRIGEPDI
jgi:hypothetical protein